MEMFKGYDPGKFYDEMFGADGSVRSHCAPLLRRFGQLDQKDFLARKANSELYFLRQGITFNVYHDICVYAHHPRAQAGGCDIPAH